MIGSGIIGKLVELLGHAEVLVVTPALRAVGNIVTGLLRLISSCLSQLKYLIRNTVLRKLIIGS